MDQMPMMVEHGHDLPAIQTEPSRMPMAMRIMLDDKLFARVSAVAEMMAKSPTAPQHLRQSVPACFDVVGRALTWGLYPYAVAQATFDAGGGKLGYEAKLVQAIMENSGQLDGGIKKEWFGDWKRVLGKFEKRKSDKGREFAVPRYTDADEEGLGIRVTAKVKGREPETFELMLRQCQPRNSTLWATDPKTQIYYVAVRRLANMVCPSLVMGVPFDDDVAAQNHLGPDNAKQINPQPAKTIEADLDQFAGSAKTTEVVTEPEPEAPASVETKDEAPDMTVWLDPNNEVSVGSLKEASVAIAGAMNTAIGAGQPDVASEILAQNSELIMQMPATWQRKLEQIVAE